MAEGCVIPAAVSSADEQFSTSSDNREWMFCPAAT